MKEQELFKSDSMVFQEKEAEKKKKRRRKRYAKRKKIIREREEVRNSMAANLWKMKQRACRVYRPQKKIHRVRG